MAAPGCNFTGNQDMYGLGIRIGFYCHWFGVVLASWVARGEFRLLKLSYFFFVGGMFLAIILETVKNSLLPVETYIALLLAFGGYLNVVPLYLWKAFTWCEPRMDPSRYPRASTGRIFQLINFTLMIALSVFQLYFWIKRVSAVASIGCVEFGFFFAQIPLNEKGFVVANILFHFFFLFTCVGVVSVFIAKLYELYEGRRHRRIGHQRHSLQRLQAISDVIVAGVVVTAIELLIRWNGIQGVNSVSTAGQTIPMIVGIGLVARVVYIGMSGDIDIVDDDWSSSSYGSYYSGSGSGSGSGSKNSGPRSEDGAAAPPPGGWPAQAPAPAMAPVYGGAGFPRPPPANIPPPPPPPPPGQ